MKYPNLIWLEKTNDCMNKTAVVKYYEIFILPRMRIDELKKGDYKSAASPKRTYVWRDPRPLHLIHDFSDFAKICNVATGWI